MMGSFVILKREYWTILTSNPYMQSKKYLTENSQSSKLEN
jgi:hypothetical protein